MWVGTIVSTKGGNERGFLSLIFLCWILILTRSFVASVKSTVVDL